jgi:3D (Asp-Asp-Asp) domain-containing protein
MHRVARSCAAIILIAVMIAGITTAALAFSGSVFMVVDGAGAMNHISSPGETIGEFLIRSDRALRELDTINVELDYRPQNGDVIRITRREYVTFTETADIPFRVVFSHSPEIKAGEEVLTQTGANGVSELTWRRFMVNGAVVEDELIGERVIVPSVDQVTKMGFRSIPISPFDFKADFDENHEPIGYTQVLRNQRSAGYWAPEGARTSTGRPVEKGLVAVDPRVIPYGSRLFVQTPDGRYILGYAIAADTGLDLRRGIIDLDVFYPVYADAWAHEIKFVDVFILP